MREPNRELLNYPSTAKTDRVFYLIMANIANCDFPLHLFLQCLLLSANSDPDRDGQRQTEQEKIDAAEAIERRSEQSEAMENGGTTETHCHTRVAKRDYQMRIIHSSMCSPGLASSVIWKLLKYM